MLLALWSNLVFYVVVCQGQWGCYYTGGVLGGVTGILCLLVLVCIVGSGLQSLPKVAIGNNGRHYHEEREGALVWCG